MSRIKIKMLFIKLMIWHKKPLLINHIEIVGKDSLRNDIIMPIMKHIKYHIIEISNKTVKLFKELPTIRYLITPDINGVLNGIIYKFIKHVEARWSLANAPNELKPSQTSFTLTLILTKLAIIDYL